MSTKQYFNQQILLPDSPPQTPADHGRQNKESFPSRSISSSSEQATIGLGLRIDPSISHSRSQSQPMRTSPVSEKNYPILPPNNPLRHELPSYKSMVESKRPLSSSLASSPHHAEVANPYKHVTLLQRMAGFWRVQRKLRPVLLIATSLLVFVMFMMFRSLVDQTALSSPFPGDELRRSLFDNSQKMHGGVPRRAKKHRHTAAPTLGEPLKLSRSEEILALISFVSGRGNALPPYIDGSKPIESSLLLGFDTSQDFAADDAANMRAEIKSMYPVVLIGRIRDMSHWELQRMLDSYVLSPTPLIVDIDARPDGDVLVPAIERLLDTPVLPQLLVHGKPIATYQELVALHDDHKLAEALEKAADGTLTVRTNKKKSKKLRDRERQAMQQILRPKEILDEDA